MEQASARAYFRFYAELNDHLAPPLQYRTLEKHFIVPGTVKDMIESFGVPHTEVELILVNGESVDFGHLIRDGDRVSVYPVFESFDVGSEVRVRRNVLREPRFVLDVHLGKLAAYMRMLGFDASYRSCASDADLARVSAQEHRILLTRDRGLLKHTAVTHGYWLRETDSKRQLAEIIRRFDLKNCTQPFTRCMACNGVLEDAPKDEIEHLLPPRTAELHHEFRRCANCAHVYWKGSHYDRMRQTIDVLLSKWAV